MQHIHAYSMVDLQNLKQFCFSDPPSHSSVQRHCSLHAGSLLFASLWITLAGHPSMNSVQNGSDSSLVGRTHSLTVLDWLQHSDVRYCQSSCLQSATCHQLNMPRHWCSRLGHRAFSTAGPRAWNLLVLTISMIHCSAPAPSDQRWRLSSSQCTGTHSVVEPYRCSAQCAL